MMQRGQFRKSDGRIPLHTDRATSQEGGGAAARAPPPCPLTPQRSEGPPATRYGREPPTGGVWQRHFPPMPCRCVRLSRQGANHHNGGGYTSFQCRAQFCQYENVRALLAPNAAEDAGL